MEIVAGCEWILALGLLAAGFCMGIGAWGPAIGEGNVASKAVEGIARQPESATVLTRTMLIGQAVTESTGIYSLVIAFLILNFIGRFIIK
ncbi:MAG: ATP synthase F0 subunit C [bacterium]|nr:ATP synthase F0 subunit C [bacterium]